MCKRIAHYSLIVIAGYLLTGMPVAAKVCCFGCGSTEAQPATAAVSTSLPAPAPAPSQGCCGVTGHAQATTPAPASSTPQGSPTPNEPDAPARHCSGASCCKAAPTLSPAPAPLSPLLICGTRQASPQALAPTQTWPLDPPPPRV
ncbi:MAG: hypothetical protein AAF750_02335 [Planctomycetota bacterium]